MWVIIARTPLYSVAQWAARFHPLLLGCQPQQLNDDRIIGRFLDRLFDADRSALLTVFVLRMIETFAICPQELHNDSTSITLTGHYEKADGRSMRGRRTLRVTWGHNKDHRFDLKEPLWILTVTEEGVPLYFKVADGNTEDSRTHWQTWQALRSLVGHPRFLYVADCKLCSRSTLRAIHTEKGRFVTILPQTKKENSQFRSWLGSHSPDWQQVASYPGRLKEDPPELIRAVGELQELKAKVEGPRSRLKSREGIAERADRILSQRGVQRWLRYRIEESQVPSYRQQRRGALERRHGGAVRSSCSTR